MPSSRPHHRMERPISAPPERNQSIRPSRLLPTHPQPHTLAAPIFITKFSIRGHSPYVCHDVYVTISQDCHTAHELCSYLMTSRRVRQNLITYALNVPGFEGKKLYIHHPLLPRPVSLTRTRKDGLFRRAIRVYARSLLVTEPTPTDFPFIMYRNT